jgi:hypothetical protein
MVAAVRSEKLAGLRFICKGAFLHEICGIICSPAYMPECSPDELKSSWIGCAWNLESRNMTAAEARQTECARGTLVPLLTDSRSPPNLNLPEQVHNLLRCVLPSP